MEVYLATSLAETRVSMPWAETSAISLFLLFVLIALPPIHHLFLPSSPFHMAPFLSSLGPTLAPTHYTVAWVYIHSISPPPQLFVLSDWLHHMTSSHWNNQPSCL